MLWHIPEPFLPRRLSGAAPAAPSRGLRRLALLMGFLGLLSFHLSAVAAETPDNDDSSADASGLIQLGPGDSIRVSVYGQESMTTTVYVGDDGNISVPLVGQVQVTGLSPVAAGKKVEQALKSGGFLNDPHVTIALLHSRSQRVAVLGKVRRPGRYTIDPKTTIFDLLAQAGGTAEDGADFVYLLRPNGQGGLQRLGVKLGGFSASGDTSTMQSLQGGDTLYVPLAQQFYIYGEVTTSNMYRLEPGMTVLQAVARAGGITARGSERRIDIKRTDKAGHYVVFHAKLSDPIQPDDVVHVKESIF
jgi:polysaccharide export outer membrane protein